MLKHQGMTRDQASLDYAKVVKKAFYVGTRPQNIFVILFGASVVLLGSLFSFFILAGPLAVGYAHACARMAQGHRVEFDDVIWRGFERIWPAIPSGFLLSIGISVFSIPIVPAYFLLLFASLVYCSIALDPEPGTGIEPIEKVWAQIRAQPVPMVVMGLIVAVICGLLTLTLSVVGVVLVVAFTFLVSVVLYEQYFQTSMRTH